MAARPEPHPQEVMDILKAKGPETRIAVVGASNNPNKYGNIIVVNLSAKGYTILPINPKEDVIAGLPAYASLADAPLPIHLVNVVTPPRVTEKVLAEVERLGLPAVWLQDGTYDDAVLEIVANAPFKTVYEACTMVVSNHD